MKEMTANEVLHLMNSGKKLSMIDVREHDEVQFGKIPGAKHIPLGEIGTRINEIEKNDEEHIIICRSGNRSKAAAGLLENQGFKTINMSGGMLDWEGPVE